MKCRDRASVLRPDGNRRLPARRGLEKSPRELDRRETFLLQADRIPRVEIWLRDRGGQLSLNSVLGIRNLNMLLDELNDLGGHIDLGRFFDSFESRGRVDFHDNGPVA